MDNNHLLIILILLAVIVIILGLAVFFLGYLVMRTGKVGDQDTRFADLVGKKRPSKEEILRRNIPDPAEQSTIYCYHHKDRRASGECAICQRGLCKDCSRSEEGLVFCLEHIQTYLTTEWVGLGEVHTTPNDTKRGAHLYKLQNDLWSKEELPSYISTSYKINLQQDSIESFVKVCVPSAARDKVLGKIADYKLKY